jgi:serpin B
MSHRSLAIALAPSLLLGLAACTNASPHTTPPSPVDPPAGSSLDQAGVARDPASTIAPASLADAVTANNAFAFDLYGHVLAGQTAPGNVLTSPVSASLALTMAYAGAQGQTATEMAAALHIGNPATVFDGQNALSAALETRAASALASATATAKDNEQPAPSASDFAFDVVNSVWGEKTYPWAQPFLTTLAKSYGTGVFTEDFVNQPDPARLAINGWVSAQTADKINDLIPQGDIDPSTRMVLVNAIHLKLPWESPFQTNATADGTFTKGDGSTVTASFMNQGEQLPYVDDGNAQIVAIPLAGGDVSVVIAVPHGDLATYEAGLTSVAIPTQSADVVLSLPKFTFTSATFSLAKSLQAMGMNQAFDPEAAQFQGMCPNPPDGDNLYVSDVLQKTMIAVQETGVEAAAATAVIMAGSSAAQQTVPVKVDKPFVMAIVDGPTGAVLFLGHVEDPTATGG